MNNDLEQFSEEELKEMLNGLNGTDENHEPLYPSVQIKLIRIALAAKQAKPVAWKLTHIAGDVSVEFNKKVADLFGIFKGNLVEPLYTTPPANSPAIPDGWKLVPIEPTDEQLRLMLAARYPATFREHLRNPLNGPKSRVEAEMLIVEVTNQYKNALSAAPKPEGE